MSTTATQILFHSPALNSLKRDQLVKLCKHHGVKANGKNTELIERLKQKAAELPPEAIEWRDSDEENDMPLPGDLFQVPARPSEQWEVVMDNIDEEDETGSNSNTLTSMRSMRTPGAAGEFGTAGSKGSVKSSLKAAIANSFGLKRAAAQEAGTSRSLPNLPSQTSLTDIPIINEPPVEPIPGAPSRPGKPAPANARLSTGTSAGMTTTIRLIASSTTGSGMDTPPRLTPFQTTFDLDMGTPTATRTNVWPASPATSLNPGRLYPTIPPEDLRPSLPSPWKSSVVATPAKGTPGTKKELPTVVPDDVFSPARLNAGSSHNNVKKVQSPAKTTGRLSVPHNEPFLFGSPLPRHSMTNNQFDNAAASVLEEMNQRLAAAGVQKVDKTVLDGAGKGVLPLAPAKPQEKTNGAERFAKAHESTFNKMDSIANHYAARRPVPGPAATNKRKSEAIGLGPGPAAKRKSSVAQTRVFSNGNRKKMGIPGAFGVDDDDDDEPEEDAGDRRSSKRIRVTETEDVHKGKRVSLLPADNKTDQEKTLEERKRQKEKEVLKKKIEARRRSSRGRPSVGARGVAPPPKPKSRFGFLGAAKSLVRNVWNMGAGAPPAKPAAVLPKPAAPPAPAKLAVSNDRGSMTNRRIPSDSMKPATTTSSSLKAPDTGTNLLSARARSPIPSFSGPSQTGLTTTTGGTVPVKLRKSSIPKPPTSSSLGARPSNAVAGSSNVNSLGLRHLTNVHSGAGSLGIKSPSPSDLSDAKSSLQVRKRTTSTLMAPTASSLAKKQSTPRPEAGPSKSGLAPVGENPISPATLHQITNGIRSPRPLPPQPTKIFSQPLSVPGSPTSPTALNENMSFAATAHMLLRTQEQAATSQAAAVPPKPKALVARKPRISRSKVIAKVGQQRSVSNSSRAGPSTGRLRSSMSAAPRRSMGTGKGQRVDSGASDVLMSAKKAARQSEYIRRKSRIGSAFGVAVKQSSDVAMDVDA